MMRGIIFKALLPVALLLSGCATTTGIKTVLVDRPVVTVEKCIKPQDIPVKPDALNKGPEPTTLDEALSTALDRISEWTRYGDKTDQIMKGCT